jgi:hypothetical protein
MEEVHANTTCKMHEILCNKKLKAGPTHLVLSGKQKNRCNKFNVALGSMLSKDEVHNKNAHMQLRTANIGNCGTPSGTQGFPVNSRCSGKLAAVE